MRGENIGPCRKATSITQRQLRAETERLAVQGNTPLGAIFEEAMDKGGIIQDMGEEARKPHRHVSRCERPDMGAIDQAVVRELCA